MHARECEELYPERRDKMTLPLLLAVPQFEAGGPERVTLWSRAGPQGGSRTATEFAPCYGMATWKTVASLL